jgi:hypothetical protein
MTGEDKYQEIKDLITHLAKERDRLASGNDDTAAEQEELSEEIALLQNDLIMASLLDDE